MASLWVFSYDIADNRRRRQIARALADAGANRVQESVFEAWLDSRSLALLRQQLETLMDTSADSLCAWPLTDLRAGRRSGSLAAPPAREQSWWLV